MPPINQVGNLKSFAVVKFTADNAVEVVSSIWIQSGRSCCLWPDKIRNYKSLVKRHAQPGPLWTPFHCIVMRDYGKRTGNIKLKLI